MNETPLFSHELLNEYVKVLINSPWPGRRGSSKRCVYFTLCFFAFIHGGFEIHASARDISNRTGLSLRTVSGALSSLIQDGKISRIRTSNTNNRPSMLADVFEMTNFMTYTREEGSRNGGLDSECLLMGNWVEFEQYEYLTWQMHDVFRWKGLGKSCLEVYYDLSMHPGSKLVDVSNRTGRALSTIYRCKHRMMDEIVNLTNYQAISMISVEDNRYSIVEQDFDGIAVILGVDGDHTKWKKRYEHQREGFRRRVLRINQELGIETDTGYIREFSTY